MSDELLWTATAFAALAGVASVALVGLAIHLAVARKRWLPLQRLRPGWWAGYEVVLAFCVVNGLPILIVATLFLIGFFNPILGVPPELDPPGPSAKSYFFRCDMVASPLTLAATLGVLFGVLYFLSRTRPRHYGLSWARWAANLGLGIAAFLIATPVVLGLHALITLGNPDDHPFVELAKNMQGWEWLFFAFQAIVRAPVLEEILFRGILLGWLRRASLGGHVVVCSMTIFVALKEAPQAGGTPSVWDYVGPGVFAVLCAAGYAFLMYRMARHFHLNETEIRQWQLARRDEPAGLGPAKRLACGLWLGHPVCRLPHRRVARPGRVAPPCRRVRLAGPAHAKLDRPHHPARALQSRQLHRALRQHPVRRGAERQCRDDGAAPVAARLDEQLGARFPVAPAQISERNDLAEPR